jgi:hypothetical protein
VPDPDRSDPEIIDFSPHPARTRLLIAIAAAAAAIGVAAAVVFAAALEDPHGIRGQSILGTVNYITAAICHLTGDQPATACTPAVRSLLPGT